MGEKCGGMKLGLFAAGVILVLMTMEGVQVLGGEVRHIGLTAGGSDGFEDSDIKEGVERDMMMGEVVEPSEHPWPMFQHDARHTGYNPNAPAYDNPGRLKWKTYLNGKVSRSVPVLGRDGRIYIGLAWGDQPGLVALDVNGSVIWRYITDAVGSSPCLDREGNIYFRTIFSVRLYSLYPNGTLRWKYEEEYPENGSYSSVTIGEDGTVYFGAGNGYLYAIYPNGTLKWRFKTGGRVATPAIDEKGVIYFGSTDYYAYAVYPNGTLKWKFKTEDQILYGPSIGLNGTVYFCSRDYYLYALYSNGTLKWKFHVDGRVQGPPAISPDGSIYFTSYDNNRIYALYSNGTLKWAFRAGYMYNSPVVGGDGTIYVGSTLWIWALNPNGTLKWKHVIGVMGGMYVLPLL